VIEWYKKMYRDCMEPEVLSWTDASNNESLQQGKAGWIHNPVSAYIVARDQEARHRGQHQPPNQSLAGPSGRHDVDAPRSIGIWKFSKNVEPAKSGSATCSAKREVYDEYIMSGGGFNQPAFVKLQDHPVLRPIPSSPCSGAKGCSTTPTLARAASDKVQLITNSFILPNMIAKAVTGTSTKDAIAWRRTR